MCNEYRTIKIIQHYFWRLFMTVTVRYSVGQFVFQIEKVMNIGIIVEYER